MGMDLLELTWKLEEDFDIKMDPGKLPEIRGAPTGKWNATANDILKWVDNHLVIAGKPIPHNTWSIVQKRIAEVTGAKPHEIAPSTLLAEGLGFM